MKYLLLLSFAFFVGCGASVPAIKAKREAGDEAMRWLSAVRQYDPEFKVPNAASEELWGRAQVFISKYSTMKIQTVSNYVIETYNPTLREATEIVYGGVADFAYTVTRSPGKDSTVFLVQCRSNNRVHDDVKICISDNERIFSFFVQTGEPIKYPEFIAN